MTIENSGYSRIPMDSPVRHGLADEAFRGMMSVWWADLLVNLRARGIRKGERHE